MEEKVVERVGSYARKQLLGGGFLLNWSHRARFRFAVSLVRAVKPRSLLDYGCGDGTFLFLLGERGIRRVGCDSDPKQVQDCQRRHGPGIEFVHTDRLQGKFEYVSCMEVLEHCTAPQRAELYRKIDSVLEASGHVVFSVPIEIGPSLAVKQLARLFLGLVRWGDYHYREKYGFLEFLTMFFAGRGSRIRRPLYTAEAGGKTAEWHGHKGFNWKAAEAEVAERFFLKETRFTPNQFSRGLLSSQAWFVCLKRR